MLSSILERLDESAPGNHRTNNHNGGNDNSIILVVMGQPSAQASGARNEKGESPVSAAQIPYNGAAGHARQTSEATHPGFERFHIAEEETAPPAPKNCFMEPGRVCVNSGACEMRGY